MNETGQRMNRHIKMEKYVIYALILGISLILGGCASSNQSSGNGQKNTGMDFKADLQTTEKFLDKALSVIKAGLENSEGVTKNSVLKVEGASLIKDGNDFWLWCGARSVDLNNTGAAVLLSSSDGGETWIFKGRMLDYPTSLETQLQQAEVFDLNRYLQSYTHHIDENGIQIGEFTLSDEEKQALVERAKTESWVTQASEVVKNKGEELGFPQTTEFAAQLDYFVCTYKGTTYYLFPIAASSDTGAPYYVARVTK